MRMAIGRRAALGLTLAAAFVVSAFLISAVRVSTSRVSALAPAGEKERASDPAQHFSVKLVDEVGKPVEGADVGLSASAGDRIREFAAKEQTEWLYKEHARSDADGIAHFTRGAEALNRVCIVARHEARKISAVLAANPADVGVSVQVELTLRPEIEIDGRATCKQLAERGREVKAVAVDVRVDGKVMLACVFDEPTFRLPLPPGQFQIEAYSDDYEEETKTVEVKSGDGPQTIEIDMPAMKLALLEGHPAPELVEVAAWQNSKPLKLAELRGKCVLLDFWGYWCGPCVGMMPELFKLHDKYAGQGLVVIGVHVDLRFRSSRVGTVAELNKKLADTRSRLWGGRGIPFPVALVTSKPGPATDGINSREDNPTVAAYGIHRFPTCVLINRQGKVVGAFYPNEEGIARLEKLLAEK